MFVRLIHTFIEHLNRIGIVKTTTPDKTFEKIKDNTSRRNRTSISYKLNKVGKRNMQTGKTLMFYLSTAEDMQIQKEEFAKC